MANQILVKFRGEGSGVGRLTWGQRGVWRSISRQGSSQYVSGVAPAMPGITVEYLADSLGFLMGRHQSLRTRLVFDADGDPQQQVFESGEIALEIVEVGDADPATVADEVRDRYVSYDFDYAQEWPVRMAAVCRDGVPTHLVAVYNHLAVDAHSLLALMDDLTTRDPQTGAASGPVTATQPLEQAAQQQSPAAQRQTDAALRHWGRVLRTVTPERFDRREEEEPRFWDLAYYSKAADLAMRSIAARLGTDTSPVLLAAYGVAMASTIGRNPVVLQLAVSNRFRPGFAGAVSPIAQSSPCLLDVADITFDQAVARAYRAAMATYLNSYYDPLQRVALYEAVNAERGAEIDVQVYFNDRRDQNRDEKSDQVPTAAEIEAALPASRLTWGPRSSMRQPTFYLDVNDAPDGVEFTITADTRYVAPDGMAAFVRAMESTVVEAARHTSVETGVHAVPETV
jgi:Condensation domain